MFNFLRKKQTASPLPSFEALETSPLRDRYPHRVVTYGWMEGWGVCVTHPGKPRMITLDEWPMYVFLECDGTKTVHEMVLGFAAQYVDEAVPAQLDMCIMEALEMLVEECIIQLADTPVQLADEYLQPKY